MTSRIFLDHISTCRPSPQAVRAMMPFFDECYGSASSPHLMGQELVAEIEKSYRTLYNLFGASPDDRFVFTSCGAEAITQMVFSVFKEVTRKTGKNHFVCLEIEEAPTILALSKLTEEACMLDLAKVSKRGSINRELLLEAITARTALVSLGYASAQTGVIHPIEEIAQVCKQRGILLHVDLTHVIGKLFLDFAIRPDYLTFNGEQLHAPRGTGGLFAQASAPLIPLINGEDEDKKLRGGPLNVPMLVSTGQAAFVALNNQDLYATEVARLRNLFETSLQKHYPEAVVLFQAEERLPHCSTIAFPGIKTEALLYDLNRKGVYANMGGGSFQQLERVLLASHVEKSLAQCALSFSFSKDSTGEELERAVDIIKESARRLRRASTHITIAKT
jgi:cysteine desulfurase